MSTSENSKQKTLVAALSSAVMDLNKRLVEDVTVTRAREFETIQSQLGRILGHLNESTAAHMKESDSLNEKMEKISSRLEVLEVAPPVINKRPRAERKKPPAGAETKPSNKVDKVINGMHFFRFMWAASDSFREDYRREMTPPPAEIADKINKEPTDAKRLGIESMYVWRNCLTEEQKEAVKQDFKRWKNTKSPQKTILDADDLEDVVTE